MSDTKRRSLSDKDLDFIEEFISTELIADNTTISQINWDKLNRVGFSGVSIYVIEYSTSRTPRHFRKFIFKIASTSDEDGDLAKKIRKERDNFRDFVYGLLEAAPNDCKFYSNLKFIGIAYPYRSNQDADDSTILSTRNLHDYFLDCFKNVSDDDLSGKNIIKSIIIRLYNRTLRKWRNDYEVNNYTWDDQYNRYIRWHRSKDRIQNLLNCNSTQEYIFYNERKHVNPVAIIEDIKRENYDFPTRFVHGDLHQRNILIDKETLDNNQPPWLIDFEWTSDKKHYLIDFTLLECSLKFQYLTTLLADSEIFSFEKCLDNDSEKPNLSGNRIRFVYDIIKEVRRLSYDEFRKIYSNAPQKSSKERWLKEYNKSLILMTTGLLGVANFEEIDKRGMVDSLVYQCEHYKALNYTVSKKLNKIGEDLLIKDYIYTIFKNDGYPQIFLDKGDDCSAFRTTNSENVILASTDPCPLPVAWIMGDLDFFVLGYYSVLINLSDLASMGGKPIGIQLSLEMPEDLGVDEFERYLTGVRKISDEFHCPVIGGNIKDGNRFLVTGTVFGEVNKQNILLRKNAKVDDTIFVIGTMGEFWSAVYNYEDADIYTRNEIDNIIKFPIPRIHEGLLLANNQLSRCCMDSSDGVISCFQEIAEQSGADFLLNYKMIYDSLSDNVKKACDKYKIPLINIALSWGEWQLITTVSKENLERFKNCFKNIPYWEVGTVIKGRGKVLIDKDNRVYSIHDFGSKRFSDISYFSNGLNAYKDYLKKDFFTEVL